MSRDDTRAEHLAWCKERALEYLDEGDVQQAFASFASDMSKHPETAKAFVPLRTAGLQVLMNVRSDKTFGEMRKFINGFS